VFCSHEGTVLSGENLSFDRTGETAEALDESTDNEFLWPLIITDTDRARTVTVGLASFTQSAESGAQWTPIAAGTVIVILPLLVVFILFQRRFVESFMYSGLKG